MTLSAQDRIPLTVLGGFLGAGKTTLLNHLLRHAAGRRWAVLVNDFGRINIDASLISARDANIISLANGCVCCQTGDDLSTALSAVLDLKPRPQAIVIEASGVSDPWRIAQVGLIDPALALESVIVLLDTAQILTHAADPLLQDTIERQVRAADLLILNQCDRASTDERAAVHRWLAEKAPSTPTFETVDAQLPPELFEEIRHSERDDADAVSWTPVAMKPQHGALFDTWQVSLPGTFSIDALKTMLKTMPAGVLRLKGTVRADRYPGAVLHFAGRHGSVRPIPAAPVSMPAESHFVAIGLRSQLPSITLEQAIAACRIA